MNSDVLVADPDTILEDLARTLEPRPASFGRYQVLQSVGEGAMSCVFKAFDPVTGRPVAVKMLRPAPWLAPQDEECRRRFHREAQAAGGLSHPNIVVIYDVDHDYFVMEFLQGLTLREILDQRGRLSLADALPILEGVADALDYAHRKGIVHRDIKPGNIMVLPDGRPKVMDFGVAHFESASYTSPGQCLGSPLYMAPEQIEGERVTAQSDVFALAAVAYEMLTGHKAFGAPTLPAILRRVLEDDPTPASQLVPGFVEHGDAALRRGLSKRAVDRPPTAAALVADLRGPQEAPPVRRGMRPAGSRRVTPPIRPLEVETQDLRLLDRSAWRGRRPSLTLPPWLTPRRNRWSTVAAALLLAIPLVSSTWVPAAPLRASQPAPARVSVPVRSEPAGAIVWVDGKPAGRTPFTLQDLQPGVRQVKLAHPGFTPIEMQIAFDARDRAPLVFRLQPLPEPPAPVVRVVRVAATPSVREGDLVPFGPGVSAPRQLSGRRPSYPSRAYPAQGLVKLEVTVNENGEPIDLTILESPHELLTREVADAVKTWRFDPARKEGVRVRVRWPVEQRFTVVKR